jgi:hypothetical protein
VQQPIERPRHPALDKEARMMELLAAEYDEEPPDDGELKGSGDNYGS